MNLILLSFNIYLSITNLTQDRKMTNINFFFSINKEQEVEESICALEYLN